MVDKGENILVEFDYDNITLIDPNKIFPESIKLIIDIFYNLKGLEDSHQLGPFHKLFWNYFGIILNLFL